MSRRPLAQIVITQAEIQPGISAALTWIAAALADADRRVLTTADLDRIDSYRGGAVDLHELLPAVLPLAHAVWYETGIITAQHGTEMIMGYLAVPVDATSIQIGWTCYAPAVGRLLGPLGPVRVDPGGIERTADLTDEGYRTLRSATGTIVRALLLRI